ncbi:MAG: hypothetical protein E7559_08955 [Ruminococcaceae bacterium]|nr:hypothetical protein [Oscillospiraceae bacterium]
MRELSDIRKELDELDARLCMLLARRAELTDEAGEYKRTRGLPVQDADRERIVLARVRDIVRSQTPRRSSGVRTARTAGFSGVNIQLRAADTAEEDAETKRREGIVQWVADVYTDIIRSSRERQQMLLDGTGTPNEE